MQFESNRAHRRQQNVLSDASANSLADDPFRYCINFYAIPPLGKISLEEGEDVVTERLNLLQICDEMLRNMENNTSFKRNKTYFETLENRLQNSDSKFDKNLYLASKSVKPSESVKGRRRDQISHFLLRLYYCRNEELKKWFISRECELLRAKLIDKSILSELPQVLRINGFQFEEVSDEEKTRFNEEINFLFSAKKSVVNQVVYKMPFEEAVEGVRNRKVFVRDGYAYILLEDMIPVICAKFRSQLSRSLAILQKCLPQLEEDQRLIPRFHSLHLHHIQRRKTAINSEDPDKEVVRPEMIDTLSKESFPPCMRNTHEVLRRDNHLKYYGRLYYGLFLKSIGLTLDDALTFFREEFTKKVAPEKFQKEYAYNIRYNYGKEGRKVVGMAYGCQKIIDNNPPGPGDSHGCPFKHFDQNNLKQMLRKHEINENDSQEILEIAKENDCGKACSKYFKSKHSWFPEINIYHPNQYYTESRKALKISALPTPPDYPSSKNDITLTAEMTTDSLLEESVFETEDEFDRSICAMDFESSVSVPNESDVPSETVQ